MLISLLLGIAGFILYFIYDINSITRRNRLLGCSFFAGCILIVCASAIQLYKAIELHAFSSASDIILIILGIISFVCLIYCLFFALPFEETYVDPEKGRGVYDKGVYALCRHPGVLCFFAMYLFIGLAALPSDLLLCGMVFSLLNFLYVIFQDLITFPKTFYDYSEYKKTVPFIIPTNKSLRRAVGTMRLNNRKEDSK